MPDFFRRKHSLVYYTWYETLGNFHIVDMATLLAGFMFLTSLSFMLYSMVYLNKEVTGAMIFMIFSTLLVIVGDLRHKALCYIPWCFVSVMIAISGWVMFGVYLANFLGSAIETKHIEFDHARYVVISLFGASFACYIFMVTLKSFFYMKEKPWRECVAV